MRALLLALILLQPPAIAQSDNVVGAGAAMTMPAQVQARPDDFFEVALTTNCKWIRWTLPPGLKRVPTKYTTDKIFVGMGPVGVYEFKAEGTLNDQYVEAKCVVFIGQPAPGPIPPTPPGPPTPGPVDPLVAQLQTLYAADPNPQKASHLASLISVYEVITNVALKNPKVKTCDQLYGVLSEAARAMIPETPGQPIPLLSLREALAGHLKSCFGNADELTDDLRVKGAACFQRLATALRGIK